jgi:predicted methyltransferase
MLTRSPLVAMRILVVAAAATAAACGVPEPKDASNAAPVPIYNTAAVVQGPETVSEVSTSPQVEAVLAEPDRDARDHALDGRYQAADLLSFFALQPGERVAELTAGGGYFTELLERDVGDGGRVFANEPASLASLPLASGSNVDRALDERLEKPINAGVVRSSLDLAAPLPSDAHDLDLVYLSLPYRTARALGVDTGAMDRAVFAALKPGGRFIVLDYRPVAGGPTRTNLHAVHAQEAASVRREMEDAGFVLLAEGRFLHNDPKPGEWDSIDAEAPTALEQQDRFLLELEKPR